MWYSVGFTAYFGPYVIIGGVFGKNLVTIIDNHPGSPEKVAWSILIIFFIATIVLIVLAYQQLLKHPSIEEKSATIHINSLDITETKDGKYLVGEKSFPTRRDAEDFVNLLKGLK